MFGMDTSCGYYAESEDYFSYILNYDTGLDLTLASARPDCYRLVSSQFLIAYENAQQPITFSKYGYNAVPKCYSILYKSDAASLQQQGTPKFLRDSLPESLDLDGSNILFGIIDSGITYTNPLFRNADGSSRILGLWDQSLPGYFSIFEKEDIDAALASGDPYSAVPSRDEIGHGTFLASLTAGNASNPMPPTGERNISEDDNFFSLAKNCSLAVVKLRPAKQNLRDFYGISKEAVCYAEDDIMSGIRYLLSVSEKTGLPLVILLGIGTSFSSHTGSSYLEQFIDRISMLPQIAVITAAGNELIEGTHYHSRASEDSSEIVELSVAQEEGNFLFSLWAKAPCRVLYEITSPTGQSFGINTIPLYPNAAPDKVSFLYEGTTLLIENILIEEGSKDQTILFRFRNPAPGLWSFRFTETTGLPLDFDCYLPLRVFLRSDTKFLVPSPLYTVLSPGNGASSLCVTAYDPVSDAIYLNASRGFTRNGMVKPELTAPGVNLTGAFGENLYTKRSGTGIAAAYTAGAVILIFQWALGKGYYPNISSGILKQLLIRGANRNPELAYPSRVWGWGILDLPLVFDLLRQ